MKEVRGEGWEKTSWGGTFTQRNGPVYERWRGGEYDRGMRIWGGVLNSRGWAHGGLLAMLLDGTMAMVGGRLLGGRAVTAWLSIEYMKPAREGDWVEATGSVMEEGISGYGGANVSGTLRSWGAGGADEGEGRGEVLALGRGTFVRAPVLGERLLG